MKSFLSNTVLVLIACGVMACASNSKETPIEQQVKAEKPANTPEAIVERAAEVFATAPGLTEDQRAQLAAVYGNVFKESKRIRGEIGQSKSLLFKMLASKGMKSKEIIELKNKIVGLDQRRLELMFKAMEDVQKIVGIGPEKEEIYRRLRDYDHPMGSEVGTM
ncbi:MAG: hypothetical protein LW875_08325 [Proteobacteria bacterium]|jgi:Spy/CpxP family protein refolding chaperone|nr:hypothetical protein [Pseudomonadota bacterium]